MSYSVTSVKLCTAFSLVGVMLMSGCSTPPVDEHLQEEEVTVSDSEEVSVEEITPEPEVIEEVQVTVEPDEPDVVEPTPTYEDVQSDYVVQKGDTLWRIAKRHNCTVADLAKWNDLHKPYPSLLVGQTLRVDSSSQSVTHSGNGGEYHVVVKKETLWGISKRYNCTVADLASWNNLTAPYVLFVGQKLQVSQ